MSTWSVEAAPGAVATQVADGLYTLRVAIFVDYHPVTQCDMPLTAEQIGANGSVRAQRWREVAARVPAGDVERPDDG